MANPWKLLRGLLPGEPLQVGTVQSHNGDGTSTVLLVGGGFVTVTGQSVAVSNRAFVKGGHVVSAAPNLPVTQIDV